MKSFFAPVVLVATILLMPLCLLFLVHGVEQIEAASQRGWIYEADAQVIDAALEGKLIRVQGELISEESLPLAGSEVCAIEVVDEHGFPHLFSRKLRLGKRQVLGLYEKTNMPFGYLGHSDRVIRNPGAPGYLPSGTRVCLIGRQCGETLDMTDAAAEEDFHYIPGQRIFRDGDISSEAQAGFIMFILFLYYLLWWGMSIATHEFFSRKPYTISRCLLEGFIYGSIILLILSVCVILS